MYSLYQALIAQHSRQLTSVRCAEQTIAQLHRYFEDVVLENNLAALVIESLPLMTERSLRDLARVREIGRAAHKAFFFVAPGDSLNDLPLRVNEQDREPILIKRTEQDTAYERFVVIADSRFSALLASVRSVDEDGTEAVNDEVIWTFEPDIVYSALEYLMARVAAERPFQASVFSTAVSKSMPKATSLQLTVSVTTKLARLLQEQAGREVAVNRIATAIRNSLELPSILQTTVNEVGRALGAQHCALCVEGEHGQAALRNYYFRDELDETGRDEIICDIDSYILRLGKSLRNYVLDGRGDTDAQAQGIYPVAIVPLIYQERFMGILLVRSDDMTRVWQESEVLLLRTVADQVTVAVNHARLFAQMQQQALTDGLTGCFNRRSFEMQLERDLHLATRMRQPLSLIMLDIDNFKHVNDNFGHEAGDMALRLFADSLREELRSVDTAARYGGDEFAVILPQAGVDGALTVAERVRSRIESTTVPGVGHITISVGIATFPLHASSRDTLVVTADRALYNAKSLGRNRVCTLPEYVDAPEATDTDAFDLGEIVSDDADTPMAPVFPFD
ncbi:MAG TPA: sensor domain-containing diguanylate cyclase [Pyrinomonadaceae bacterium]|nr:sensor domain-containing diguanylate cyclase [Pyrinomonadaceae bacterium]